MCRNTENIFVGLADFTFVNPGFSDFPEILKLQDEGKKIRLVFENDLVRNDFFQITSLFPFHFTAFLQKYTDLKILQKTINLAPHLFVSQKVFYPASQPFLNGKARIADILFKNRFQQKMQLLSAKQKESLRFMQEPDLNGLFFQEYRLNLSRLFMEILHHIQFHGGEIRMQNKIPFSAKKVETGKVVFCKPEATQVYTSSIETYPGFCMQVQYKTGRICFFENKAVSGIQVIYYGKDLITKDEIIHLLKSHFQTERTDLAEESVPLKITVPILKEIVRYLKSSLPGAFQETKFENMFELCRVKFDIAKQTGIDFPEFRILFHRYGKFIDEIIDRAYETMDETREPSKIWELSERWFQKEKEWKN